MSEECESCPQFNGRGKYCDCGLSIGVTDKRICIDHPKNVDYNEEGMKKRQEYASKMSYMIRQRELEARDKLGGGE